MTRRYLAAVLVAGAAVAGDLLTKRWAGASFRDGPVVVVDPLLTFTFVENPGSAFSLFQGAGTLLALAALVAVGFIAGALRSVRAWTEVVGLGLVAGGAVGNLVDRVARGPGFLDGMVIDWIQLPNWPVFNLADAAITVGIGFLIVSSWLHRESQDSS